MSAAETIAQLEEEIEGQRARLKAQCFDDDNRYA